jgi:predicted permease
MQLHIDLAAADLRERGVAADEAHRRARAAFGSVLATRDEVRQVLGVQLLDEFRADVIYACRVLRRSPMFAAVAILSLGLGIGANAAIFNLIDTVLLKSLPVQDPSTLFFVDNSGGRSGGSSGPPYPCFEILRDSNTTLSGIAAFDDNVLKVTIDGESEEVRGQYASGNYFDVLGVRPAFGRLLLAADDSTISGGATDGAVAVISYEFWRRRFNLDPAAVGRTIGISNRAVTIVGVTPPEYFGLQVGVPVDVIVPITLSENNLHARSLWWFSVVGRIKPGVEVEQARTELHRLWDRYMTDNGQPPDKRPKLFPGIALVPAARGLAALRRQWSEPLLIVMAIVGVVLFIGCANIANLLLARASARRNELAVRLAVGASRARLIRQLLTEGAVLSAAGAIAGLVVARVAATLIVTILARADHTRPLDAPLDWRLLSFIAIVGVAAALLFSLVPALHATRTDGARPASSGTTSISFAHGRLGQSLVVVQVTLSLILLSAATLFVRTLQNLERMDSGFNAQNVIALEVQTQLPASTVSKPTRSEIVRYHTQLARAWTALGERVAALPGMQASAVATMAPLTGRTRGVLVSVSGGPALSEEERGIHINHVTAGYFATLHVGLEAGRYFTLADRAGAPRVAILNRVAARAYFADTNPIGRRISFPGQQVEDEFEIVGVVGDVRYKNARTEDERMAYLPIEQSIDGIRSAIVVARTAFTGGHELRDEIATGITGGFAPRVLSLDDQARSSLARERLLSMLASFFAVLALLLACIGLYGVMAYGVMRRTREIGIRLAVGASRRSVMWMMLRETLIVVSIGVVAGVIAVVPATRALRNQLFGVTPADPVSVAIAATVLVVVSVLAGFLPARRATRVDPLLALRCE